MQTLQILVGILIIILTYLDFFKTTISGHGFGLLSKYLNKYLSQLILANKTKSIFNYSGMIHLLSTTTVWLVLLFLGTFIIFTSGPEMVLHSTTQLPATLTERFYFCCYLLSTLGIGDFVPGTPLSQVIAGILSFSGFILITTGMTYLLSVMNSVLGKKELAFFISTVGADMEQLYQHFKADENLSSLLSISGDLRKQIISNSSTYFAFPMVHYFLTRERKYSVVVQLGVLYEVLNVLRKDWKKGTPQYVEISSILNAIEYYLKLGLDDINSGEYNKENINTLRSYWQGLGYTYKHNTRTDRLLGASLYNAGWSWEDVYKYKEQA